MDYRAIAELVLMTFLGLSAFAIAFGFSVKVFLGPVVRDAVRHLGAHQSGPLPRSPEGIEHRLDAIEERLDLLLEAQRFDRELGRPPSE